MVLGTIQIPSIYLLAAGIILIIIGYALGSLIQALEDGLLLIFIRIAGFATVIYFVAETLFGISLL